MSFKNNFVPVDYPYSFSPRSWNSVYLPLNHNCPNPKTGAPRDTFALTVPFMNSIAAPNMENPHIATVRTAKNRLPTINQQSTSNFISQINQFQINNNDLHLRCKYSNSEWQDPNFSVFEEYQEPKIEHFKNRKEHFYQNKKNKNISNDNISNDNNTPINNFPLAWTCYKDHNNKWCCPMRGDSNC